MTIRWCVFLCTLLICSTLQVSARRGFGGGSRSYPKSGGLSGSRSPGHSYPTNHGGLSGNSPGRPSSGGQAHAYPSSGGQSHAYPSSGGQSHGYPSSGGSHGYPAASPGGLSGNSPSRPAVSSNTHTTHTTNVNYNYHYSPPQQIRYTPPHGGAPMSYPVYQHPPPAYVYHYKDSGSKYGTLLAGLALLNLGTLAGAAYAHSGHSSGSGYKAAPGEICKFGVKKDNGDYEETRIDCQLITSFIFQDQQAKAQNGGGTNTTVVTTTVTNVTMVNGTNGGAVPAPAVVPGNIVYTMLPNGTLVPLNGTLVNGTFVQGAANATSPQTPSTNGAASSVTMTTTNTTTTVVNALDVKGKPVDVTPGMQCYVIRHTSSSNMKRSVPCGVLQSYATQSLKKNSAARNLPVFTAFAALAAIILAY
ncbi:Uncharacterized protein OBRU01_18364 [Operophtera brumata]|uniref:Uncharacterized protein n=1 Tax=Operophtera brumata TaxID=104452 RepID=A0A0L7KZ76_OPEBR|nr:Uncharacterized protein OBRU01_18364 [Operophtera brumata]